MILLLLGSGLARAGLVLQFDYSYDTTTNFFADPGRRAVMAMAADSINRWIDHLSAVQVVPASGNTWTAQVVRPDTGFGTLFTGPSIAADTMTVYVGGRGTTGALLPVNVLAETNNNATLPSGTQAWKDLVRYRGQTGAPSSDYGPWGAAIAFNPNFNWYSGTSPTGIGATQYDLYTVAVHELVHALGFGLAASYNALVTTGHFAGPKAMAVGSSTNPTLLADGSHWAAGTVSTIAGQAAASPLTPGIPAGQRLRMTDLDAAALDDIGWQAAVAGDNDRDGVVNFDDAFTLTNNYGLTNVATWSLGDFDGDGDVDFDDAFEQVNNYGASAPALAGSFTSGSNPTGTEGYFSMDEPGGGTFTGPMNVPEPSTALLLSLGAFSALGLARCGRRHRRLGRHQ